MSNLRGLLICFELIVLRGEYNLVWSAYLWSKLISVVKHRELSNDVFATVFWATRNWGDFLGKFREVRQSSRTDPSLLCPYPFPGGEGR